MSMLLKHGLIDKLMITRSRGSMSIVNSHDLVNMKLNLNDVSNGNEMLPGVW